MSPLALELVRRMSWLALAAAVLLLTLPRASAHLGLWGPTVADEIGSAERALGAAREYGAKDHDAAFQAARNELGHARELTSKGNDWRARQAARRASVQAIDAQRAALGARESARRRSATVATEIDRRLNDLENIYVEVSVGADKRTASALVSVMKDARRKGASVFLAIEEGDYDLAVGQEAVVLEALEAARRELEAHRRPPTAGG